MPRLVAYILSILIAVGATAQVNVSGTVVDKESNEPLTGASVIVKGADGKIKKYATSKGDRLMPETGQEVCQSDRFYLFYHGF